MGSKHKKENIVKNLTDKKENVEKAMTLLAFPKNWRNSGVKITLKNGSNTEIEEHEYSYLAAFRFCC